MRNSCIKCVLKHISSAWVISTEIENGNVNLEHICFLIGHLTQAEEQSLSLFPEIATLVRKNRNRFMEIFTQTHTEDMLKLYVSQIEFSSIIKVVQKYFSQNTDSEMEEDIKNEVPLV